MNAVALFFVIELDDLMVDDYDYGRVKQFFANDYSPKYYPDFKYKQTKFESICAKVAACILILFIMFGFLGAFVAPFYMAICY